MAKKGKTPSLIGGTHGTVSFATSGRSHPCKRCETTLPKGTACVRVKNPRTMSGARTYCVDCFGELLDQTQTDLDSLRDKLAGES